MGGGVVRKGDYKLLFGHFGYAGWYGHFSPNSTWRKNNTAITRDCWTNGPCLYDVSGKTHEPTEHDDLAGDAAHQDVKKELIELFHSYDSQYHPPTDAPAAGCPGLALSNGLPR